MGLHKNGNVEYMGFVSEKEKFAIIDGAKLCIGPLPEGQRHQDQDARLLHALQGHPGNLPGHSRATRSRTTSTEIVENDPDRYVSQIMRLERSPELGARLGANASKLCDYYSYSNVGSKWDSLLAKLA